MCVCVCVFDLPDLFFSAYAAYFKVYMFSCAVMGWLVIPLVLIWINYFVL